MYTRIEGTIQCEQDQRTLEMVKRPAVSETTSFIWATESTRSFTACVCSSRAPLSTLVMRAMRFSAHSLYGRRMASTNAHAYSDQHPFCYSPQLVKSGGSSLSHLDHRKASQRKKNRKRNEKFTPKGRVRTLGDTSNQNKVPNCDDGPLVEHVKFL
jgi:hypothetical protein